jgi:hypothetical protein
MTDNEPIVAERAAARGVGEQVDARAGGFSNIMRDQQLGTSPWTAIRSRRWTMNTSSRPKAEASCG